MGLVYLPYIYHKSQPHVCKYTSPMDSMGSKFSGCQVVLVSPCFVSGARPFIPGPNTDTLHCPLVFSRKLPWKTHQKTPPKKKTYGARQVVLKSRGQFHDTISAIMVY